MTVLDLGAWGALYTEGWERQVAATGAPAKKTKMTINRERIYPPLTGNRDGILAAACCTPFPASAMSAPCTEKTTGAWHR